MKKVFLLLVVFFVTACGPAEQTFSAEAPDVIVNSAVRTLSILGISCGIVVLFLIGFAIWLNQNRNKKKKKKKEEVKPDEKKETGTGTETQTKI